MLLEAGAWMFTTLTQCQRSRALLPHLQNTPVTSQEAVDYPGC